MWFKQLQVFNISGPISRDSEGLEAQLEKMIFEPCKAHTATTSGWVAPLDEDDESLVYTYKHYRLFCLQIEEKILPPYVIVQELKQKIRQLEISEARKIARREKYVLKDEIYQKLLPQAFSRIRKIYAYFDLTNKKLMLNTVNAKRTEIFLSMLHKSFENISIEPLVLKSLNTIMTHWIQKEDCPKSFAIEDTCLLQKPLAASKMIKIKGQDLFARSIQLFLTDGYKVNELTITWQDRVTLVLKENFHLCAIRYLEVVVSEAKNTIAPDEEQWTANFIIMVGILNLLVEDLLKVFEKK